MFTLVNRRKINPDTAQETLQRAQQEFFPKLKAADGFVGFYLVQDEMRGENVAVIVFEDEQKAMAFRPEGEAWGKVLDSMGHTTVSDNWGRTVVAINDNS